MPGQAQQKFSEADLNAHIPAPILEKLIALRPVLEKQGTVLIRHGRNRKQGFYLRFREQDSATGRWVHRAVPMGGWEVGPYARLLVKKWRAERRVLRAAERAVQVETARRAKLEAQARRVERQLIRKILPGGRLFKRNAIKQFDGAAGKSRLHALAFLLGMDGMKPRGPGRPRRGRLW